MVEKKNTYRELSAYDAMKEVKSGESWKLVFFDFVDGFRRHPSVLLIRKDPVKLNPKPEMYALLQSICFQLCLEHQLNCSGWVLKKVPLTNPWFVSGVKSLYAMALRDSPLAFRRNNIFVLDNFMSRV